VFGGHFGASNSTKQLVPSYVATVIGFSSDTLSGHAYLNGGGGLHVAFGTHSTLIAAMQPSLALNTVQRASFDVVVGVEGGPCVFGGFVRIGPWLPGFVGFVVVGGGGFAITTGGLDGGGVCGCVVGGGGLATTTGGCWGCGSDVCDGGGCGGGLDGPGDDCT
jgi:hypothetical protein